MGRVRGAAIIIVTSWLAACSGGDDPLPMDGGIDASTPDGGRLDSGATDAGRTDVGSADGGTDAGQDAGPDAGSFDSAVPDAGLCAVPCDDANPCTDDTCNEMTGICSFAPRMDGTACGVHAACFSGTCFCDADFQDCDAAPGCESSTRSDPANCGACGTVCVAPTPSCLAGRCGACAADTDCADDGLDCTAPPRCVVGACEERLAPGACLIAGSCFMTGDPDPTNPCRICSPAANPRDWTLARVVAATTGSSARRRTPVHPRELAPRSHAVARTPSAARPIDATKPRESAITSLPATPA